MNASGASVSSFLCALCGTCTRGEPANVVRDTDTSEVEPICALCEADLQQRQKGPFVPAKEFFEELERERG
jgi:hypothetical protein